MYPCRYALKIKTEPTEEPLTADDVKTHLKIDSGTLSETISETPTINIASYSTGTSTGTGVDVMGYGVIVNAVAGAITAGGSVSIHLEESDDDVTYADVVGSTFTSLSTANQNSVVEKEYTGSKQYVRANATVTGAAAIYGVNVLKQTAYSPEDTYIESLITATRTLVEEHIGRRLITQTWNFYLDNFDGHNTWPQNLQLGLILNAYGNGYIKLPYAAPLQSVTSVTYRDSDETTNTMSTSDYIVDTISEPGRVVLGYGKSWPSATLSPSNPINIEYVTGYGTSTAVPKEIKQAMLLIIGDLYNNRENSREYGELKEIPIAARRLLANKRVWM